MGEVSDIDTTCPELSGLCLAPDGKGFLAASDANGVHHVSWTGETTDFFVQEGWFDCEGVTVDPKTKDVYYAFETKQEVRRLSYPDYDDAELVCIIEDVGLGTNNGLEGITWYKDRTFFIGNQYDPILLIRYSLDKGELSRKELTGLSEIAELCYDPMRDVLWISDSNKRTINLCTVEGEILAIYPIPFIDNGEGLCVDHAHSCIWVSDDTTSKIYRISFKGL